MKKVLSKIILLTLIVFSQGFSNYFEGNVFTGIGISDFENQSKTGFSLTVGLRIDYCLNSNFSFGIGIHTTALKFKIDKENQSYVLPTGRKVIASGESEFSQTLYFMNVKYSFEALNFKPYILISPGLFSGAGKLKGKYRYENDTYEQSGSLSFDFKNTFVLGIGAGIVFKEFERSKLLTNISYNFIEVEPELSQSQTEGGNNFSITIEYSYRLTKT